MVQKKKRQKAERNRQLILAFFSRISGTEKSEEQMAAFVDDPQLMTTMSRLDQYLPNFELLVDEITAEDDRVIIQARATGIPARPSEGVFPAGKKMEIPLALGCRIKSKKIIDHWIIVDHYDLLKKILAVESRIIHSE